MIEESGLASTFERLVTDLDGGDGSNDVQIVVERAVQAIPPCTAGSITVRVRGDRLETLGSTSASAARADALQYELREGPCVDAATLDEICLLSDTSAPERWVTWAAEVVKLDLHSVLSIRLLAGDRPFGALNLYADRPRAFSGDDIDLATSYAAIASHALHTSRKLQGLEIALHSRHMIGVAQGILMSKYGLGLDQAFAVLQRYSQNGHRKLRDVAAQVVSDRGLPEQPEQLEQLGGEA